MCHILKTAENKNKLPHVITKINYLNTYIIDPVLGQPMKRLQKEQ